VVVVERVHTAVTVQGLTLKKILRPLLAGAGLAGGLVAANRALQNAPLPTNALGGTRRRWNWRGHEIFATEAGEGPLVLLVHGIYTGCSSYEYRELFPLLAERHRVVAFDLLGCGLSDKPNVAYTTELFVQQIVDAIDAFGDEPTALVGSSLGAAFAIRAAMRASDRVARLAAICPTGLGGILDRDAPLGNSPVTAFFRSPLVGEGIFNVLASKPSIRRFLEHRVYGNAHRVTPEIVDQYYALTHQPGARYVPAAFAGGMLNCDVARDLPFLMMPLLILWGEKAPATSPRTNAEEFLRLAKGARLATFAESGLLPQEEEPVAVDEALEEFLSPIPH
jgi:pimeloyl-ACP methyl ester carboxylesterase